MVIFAAWLASSIMVAPDIEIGLEQEMAMPDDSHVRKYLLKIGSDMQVGPPVYWVIKPGLDYSDQNHQNLICGTSGCKSDSVLVQIFMYSQIPDR